MKYILKDIPINDENYVFTHASNQINDRTYGRVMLQAKHGLPSLNDSVGSASYQNAGFHIFVERVDYSDVSQRTITTKPTTSDTAGTSIEGHNCFGIFWII